MSSPPRRVLRLLLLLALCLARPAFAQAVEPADTRRWSSIGDLLRDVEPAYSDVRERQSAQQAVPPKAIARQLDWSAEAGFLIRVRIQAATDGTGRAAPFGPPLLLGVGKDVVDAAVASADAPPLDTQVPAPGMRYSPERSFYVWAHEKRGWFGGIRFARLSPLESEGMDAAAATILSDPSQKLKLLAERRSRIMDGIAAQLARRSIAPAARDALKAAASAYRTAGVALANLEDTSTHWQSRKLEDERALALVVRYRNILTLAGLRDQAMATLFPIPRKEVRKASTADAIVAVLNADIADMTQKLAGLDPAQARQREMAAYRAFVDRASAEKSADKAALSLLLPRRF